MPNAPALAELSAAVQLFGSICQMCTALVAVAIAVITFRYTKRQNALALINQNNTLANLVNSTIIQSDHARQTLGKLNDFVVGCPDDAVLFMYLNYVHNTFRMHQIGAVSAQVWMDTLASCAAMMGRLRRDQLERLLSRGYELAFQTAVLARYDQVAPSFDTSIVATLHPANTRQHRMALVG